MSTSIVIVNYIVKPIRTNFSVVLLVMAGLLFSPISDLPAQNINYQDLFTDATFPRNLNTSREIGSTSGSAQVTLSGGATYSIPFSLPAGTNHVVPSMGLAYNSQAGNGPAGVGWGVTGLSTITRVVKNHTYDNGAPGPIVLNNNDRYALDGNRLVATSGNSGSNNTIYQTRDESFVKITSIGYSGSGPDWFKVETKTGMTYEYGRTADARLNKINSSTVITWAVNRMYDNYGNYVDFTYTNPGQELLIDRVLYTGNKHTNQVPYNSINFNYGRRSDRNTTYVAGTPLYSHYLLTEVVVESNGQRYRKYDLDYGYDGVHSYLRSVEESGRSSLYKFNTTRFKYGTPTQELTRQTAAAIVSQAGSSVDVYSGDYNGDGYTDLMIATNAYTSDYLKYHTDFKIYRKVPNSGSSFGGVLDVRMSLMCTPKIEQLVKVQKTTKFPVCPNEKRTLRSSKSGSHLMRSRISSP